MKQGDLALSVKFSNLAVNDAQHASVEPWSASADGTVTSKRVGRIAEFIRLADAVYTAGARTALPTLARAHLQLVRLIAEAERDGADSDAAKQLKELSMIAVGMLDRGLVPEVAPLVESAG